jgi:hypothetical protein
LRRCGIRRSCGYYYQSSHCRTCCGYLGKCGVDGDSARLVRPASGGAVAASLLLWHLICAMESDADHSGQSPSFPGHTLDSNFHPDLPIPFPDSARAGSVVSTMADYLLGTRITFLIWHPSQMPEAGLCGNEI